MGPQTVPHVFPNIPPVPLYCGVCQKSEHVTAVDLWHASAVLRLYDAWSKHKHWHIIQVNADGFCWMTALLKSLESKFMTQPTPLAATLVVNDAAITSLENFKRAVKAFKMWLNDTNNDMQTVYDTYTAQFTVGEWNQTLDKWVKFNLAKATSLYTDVKLDTFQHWLMSKTCDDYDINLVILEPTKVAEYKVDMAKIMFTGLSAAVNYSPANTLYLIRFRGFGTSVDSTNYNWIQAPHCNAVTYNPPV